jgi:DNA repair protein RadC
MNPIHIEIVKLQLIRETQSPYLVKILSPKQVIDMVRDLIGHADCEHFIALYLNMKNEVNAIQTIAIGSIGNAIVHPREVFKGALLYNATSVVLAHNHPSGDPEPSPEDQQVTQRLVECGELLCVKVLDHIIIGSNDRYYSFGEHGFMSP